MPTPIRLEHASTAADQQTNIEITLGNRCNYACSYCPDNLHDGSLGWLDPSDVRRFLHKARDRFPGPILVQYTGGEPTQYPGFLDLLKFGVDLGLIHSMISNGSRTIRFWEKVTPLLDHVNFTFHQEFADLDHFSEVVRVVSRGSRVRVNFTMIPDKFDQIFEAAQSLAGLDNTSVALKPLRINFGAELYPYSDDQLNLMREYQPTGAPGETRDKRDRMRVVYDEGSTETKRPSKFVLDGDNRWKGWRCWAGIQELIVSNTGDIYRGVCRVGGAIGNVRDEDYGLPSDPIICTKMVCSCPTDIMTRKEKIDAEEHPGEEGGIL